MASKRARSPYATAAMGRPQIATQRDFLDAVLALTLELDRAPNAVEIAARVGIGRVGARKRLLEMQKAGLLADAPKVVSSGQWTLTDAGKASRGPG